jgi:uncharacterized RmlC-like cupin family protein
MDTSSTKTFNTAKSVKVTSLHDLPEEHGPQNQWLIPVINNQICGSSHIAAGLVMMPPLRTAKPHIHKNNELIIFFTEGWAATLFGPELTPIIHGPGETLYVPEGVIHMGVNLSAEHRIVGMEIRTDPYFNEDVVIMTELEEKAAQIAAELQAQFKAGTLKLPKDFAERGYGPFAPAD